MLPVNILRKVFIIYLRNITYRLEHLTPTVEVLKYEESGHGFIVDANGMVISYPKYPDSAGTLNIFGKEDQKRGGSIRNEGHDSANRKTPEGESVFFTTGLFFAAYAVKNTV